MEQVLIIYTYIHTDFQTMKKVESMQTGDCSNCLQKETLLYKYQKLISLYKKKQLKLSGTNQSHISSALTNIQSAPYDPRGNKLITILEVIVKKRQSPIFTINKQRSSKKLALLSIQRIVKNKTFQTVFNNLNSCFLRDINEKSDESQTLESISKSNNISGFQEYKDCDGECFIPLKNRLNIIKEGLFELKGNMKSKQSSCSLVQMSIINKKLEAQVKYLRKCLQQSNRRQQKQNQKKKDSLSALAEDIQQKNQIISQLQNALKAYERKYEKNNNVLEDDPVALRKQVQHLQNVSDRLNGQVFKLRQQLQQNRGLIINQQKQIKQLQKQNQQINSQNLHNRSIKDQYEREKTHLDILIDKITHKMKKLLIQQKQLQKEQKCQQTINQQIDQFKSELILFYLANINLPNHQIKSPHLFDQQEKSFLKEHKNKYIELQMQANKYNKSYLLDQYSRMQDIKGKGLHNIQNRETFNQNSIFSIIQQPKEKQIRGVLSDRQGVTMKIFQLELQKSKMVEKISELKQKIMHIRVLFKNLLKSLDLQQNSLKSQTQGVLRVIFDMYEYSEEERQQMFQKKKKMFGFI